MLAVNRKVSITKKILLGGATGLSVVGFRGISLDEDSPDKAGSEPGEAPKFCSIATKNFKYVEEEGDHEEWEKSHMNCSFCAGFVSSPCKVPFILWSKCIDKARSIEGVDYIEGCKEYTRGLMQCMDVNAEWFQAEAERQQMEAEAYEREHGVNDDDEEEEGEGAGNGNENKEVDDSVIEEITDDKEIDTINHQHDLIEKDGRIPHEEDGH